MRLRHAFIALSLCLLIAGCSRVGLVYNNLRLVAGLELSDFVDLQREQRGVFDSSFNNFWNWHRSTQLPSYAEALRAAATFTETLPDENRIRETRQQMAVLARPSVGRILEDGLPLFVSMSDAQVQSLLEELDERSAKGRRKRQKLSDEEWAEDTRERALDGLKDWTGAATPAQRERLQQWAAEILPLRPPEADGSRRREFATLLAQRTEPAFATELQTFFLASSQEEEAGSRGDHFLRSVDRLATDLMASTTEAQRAHLRKRLLDMAAELDKLSLQPPA